MNNIKTEPLEIEMAKKGRFEEVENNIEWDFLFVIRHKKERMERDLELCVCMCVSKTYTKAIS